MRRIDRGWIACIGAGFAAAFRKGCKEDWLNPPLPQHLGGAVEMLAQPVLFWGQCEWEDGRSAVGIDVLAGRRLVSISKVAGRF